MLFYFYFNNVEAIGKELQGSSLRQIEPLFLHSHLAARQGPLES